MPPANSSKLYVIRTPLVQAGFHRVGLRGRDLPGLMSSLEIGMKSHEVSGSSLFGSKPSAETPRSRISDSVRFAWSITSNVFRILTTTSFILGGGEEVGVIGACSTFKKSGPLPILFEMREMEVNGEIGRMGFGIWDEKACPANFGDQSDVVNCSALRPRTVFFYILFDDFKL